MRAWNGVGGWVGGGLGWAWAHVLACASACACAWVRVRASFCLSARITNVILHSYKQRPIYVIYHSVYSMCPGVCVRLSAGVSAPPPRPPLEDIFERPRPDRGRGGSRARAHTHTHRYGRDDGFACDCARVQRLAVIWPLALPFDQLLTSFWPAFGQILAGF